MRFIPHWSRGLSTIVSICWESGSSVPAAFPASQMMTSAPRKVSAFASSQLRRAEWERSPVTHGMSGKIVSESRPIRTANRSFCYGSAIRALDSWYHPSKGRVSAISESKSGVCGSTVSLVGAKQIRQQPEQLLS